MKAPLGSLLEAEQFNQANGTIETFKKVMTSRHFESAKCNTQIPGVTEGYKYKEGDKALSE